MAAKNKLHRKFGTAASRTRPQHTTVQCSEGSSPKQQLPHFKRKVVFCSSEKMQDPNEDTEWNDILRAKGIIPEKPKEKEIHEDDIIAMMDAAIKEKSGGM